MDFPYFSLGTGPINNIQKPSTLNLWIYLQFLIQAEEMAMVFLLKFHCELNPIEQCYRYAKHIYWMYSII